MEFIHESVLLHEAIAALGLKARGVYVDCTAGGGGHSEEILKRGGIERLICIDQDEDAIAAAKNRLRFSDKAVFVKGNFSELKRILRELSIEKVDGLLYDLGVSSYQIDAPERGFSYMQDAPLDMRMAKENPLTAEKIVNGYPLEGLTRVFREYGEEKYAYEIAKKILRRREEKRIETTLELSDLIKSALPPRARYEAGHPAKRVFQAIRIEVNGEIALLKDAIEDGIDVLNPEGKIAVITFHSLEDRIVKNLFSERARGCICPKDFPVCVCGKKPVIELTPRKAILPSEEEIRNNPRAKSAKLRTAKKLRAGEERE